jgi:hypothetical protein
MFGRPRQLFGAVIALNSRSAAVASDRENRELVEDRCLRTVDLARTLDTNYNVCLRE